MLAWARSSCCSGTGEPEAERCFARAAAEHPDRFACRIGFDEPSPHRIEAGADFFLMPSRFEPCGLNQMYSLRYGTLPIVRRTGGLADSVVDLSDEKPGGATATGFTSTRRRRMRCWPQSAGNRSVSRAVTWRKLQQNGDGA